MTTYRSPSWWTEISDAKVLSPKAIEYFRARIKNRLHQLVLAEFQNRETAGFTRADLAKRIGKRPEQITRLLGAPGNWTLDTVSDLLLAMGYELVARVKKYDDADSSEATSSEWPIDRQTGSVQTVRKLRLVASNAPTVDDDSTPRRAIGG